MELLLGKKGMLFIVSAPAGSGKTTLVRKLTAEFPNIVQSISFTTRLPRKGEIDGVDYHFITEAEFKEKIASNDFLEYVTLYGTYYGTSSLWIQQQLETGKHVVLVIDTQGALELKNRVAAIRIFIRPPSIEALRSRMMQRQTESLEVIEKRLAEAKRELEAAVLYDYCFINDDLNVAYRILSSIFIAESHRNNKER